MRIAIASDDGKTVAFHPGRCKGFVVVDIGDGGEDKKQYVENSHAHHHHDPRGGMHHDGGHEHGHGHGRLLEVLSGVSLFVARGMGRKLYDDLLSSSIQPAITKLSDVDTVIKEIKQGTFQPENDGCCIH